MLLSVFVLFLASQNVQAANSDLTGKWTLQFSTVTYKITHLLKTAEGISHDAKGKGVCDNAGHCKFLVAVPVKSFDSGNSNRDLHMIETVKGATHPMVLVQFEFDAGSAPAQALSGDAVVEFAGVNRKVHIDSIQVAKKSEKEADVDLTIPIVLTQFQIERPSLLMVPIEDIVPIHAHGTWTHG